LQIKISLVFSVQTSWDRS